MTAYTLVGCYLVGSGSTAMLLAHIIIGAAPRDAVVRDALDADPGWHAFLIACCVLWPVWLASFVLRAWLPESRAALVALRVIERCTKVAMVVMRAARGKKKGG